MRVSTDGDRQVLNLQRSWPPASTSGTYFEDHASGSRCDLAGSAALAFARSGDCLVVSWIASVGRCPSASRVERAQRALNRVPVLDRANRHHHAARGVLVFGAVRAFAHAGAREGRPGGGKPMAIDSEKLAAVIAALDGGATKAVVCRT
jgi:hypothetical protein